MRRRIQEWRDKEIQQLATKTKKRLESMDPWERIIETVSEYKERDPKDELPKTVVLSESFFKKWFKWCQKNNHNFKKINRLDIVLDKSQPFDITLIHNKISR